LKLCKKCFTLALCDTNSRDEWLRRVWKHLEGVALKCTLSVIGSNDCGCSFGGC
jgi:hypothetical protein